jgi:hypothetical protein
MKIRLAVHDLLQADRHCEADRRISANFNCEHAYNDEDIVFRSPISKL